MTGTSDIEPTGDLGSEAVQVAGEIFTMVHDRLREHLQELDASALTWRPTAEMNSIAILVSHILGAETEVLSLVIGRTSTRDREAEFRVEDSTVVTLLDRIETTQQLVTTVRENVSTDQLRSTFSRRDGRSHSGLRWLIWSAGHAREHLGQVGLLRDLYLARL